MTENSTEEEKVGLSPSKLLLEAASMFVFVRGQYTFVSEHENQARADDLLIRAEDYLFTAAAIWALCAIENWEAGGSAEECFASFREHVLKRAADWDIAIVEEQRTNKENECFVGRGD